MEHADSAHSAMSTLAEGAAFHDPRTKNMTLTELSALYDALAAAKDAFGARITDNRVKFGPCEDMMIDFEDSLGKWVDGVVGAIRTRRPSTLTERDLRSDVLIRHELNCGTEMAGIARLATALAVESFN